MHASGMSCFCVFLMRSLIVLDVLVEIFMLGSVMFWAILVDSAFVGSVMCLTGGEEEGDGRWWFYCMRGVF